MPTANRRVIYFGIFVAALSIALALAWRSLDTHVALAALFAIIGGSVLACWRLWEDRGSVRLPNQASALPKRWEKWVLGESGRRKP